MNNLKFNVSVEKARQSGTDEAFIELINEVKMLHDVYILMSPEDKNKVFFGELDEHVWIFIYTSLDQLRQSAPVLLGEDKPAYYVKSPSEEAFPWFVGLQSYGVYGIRFNEGPFGFWITLTDVEKLEVGKQQSEDNVNNVQEQDSINDAQSELATPVIEST